ncbi:MAG: sulfite exporter TauE/SafE family protein [Proteobacteria bacterium]|nr:sulfite exporter TauE/SafE family protein [Pseudomonadota bacterium]
MDIDRGSAEPGGDALQHRAGGGVADGDDDAALGGIGGGVLTNPYLLWCSVEIRRSVATAAACTLPAALAGSAGFILAGLNADGLPQFSSGYVYWPAVAGMAAASLFGAPLGAAIAHNAPTRGLRRALAILLMIVGLKMLLA